MTALDRSPQLVRQPPEPSQEASPRSPGRVMVLWLPGWTVAAALAAAGEREPARPGTVKPGGTEGTRPGPDLDGSSPADQPDAEAVVVVRANRVVGASAAARADGVVPGLRLREAQGRCPNATVVRADDAAESRLFAGVLDLVEDAVPGVEVIQPGSCAIPLRGAARFYGGEAQAAAAVVAAVVSGSALAARAGARAGIADDVFTAQQAALTMLPSPVIVARGRSRDFVSPLPIDRLGDADLVGLLHRLGIATFGQFAALDAELVATRLGPTGAILQERVRGEDGRGVVARERHEDLSVRSRWDDPVQREDQLAFALREPVGALVDSLRDRRLVATAVRIVLLSDAGGMIDRVWNHPQCFDASAIIDRVRWQVQESARAVGPSGWSGADGGGWGASPESGDAPGPLSGGVVEAVILPERVDEAYRFERPLFGVGASDRIAQGLARVQAIVGHDGVLVARIAGGRSAADRRVLIPWGETAAPRVDDGPWPGRLPSPAPSIVYAQRIPARVTDRGGRAVTVDDRGAVSAEPSAFEVCPPGRRPRAHRITGWAGPWPVSGRWWDTANRSGSLPARSDRFQCVDEEGVGWLLVAEAGAGEGEPPQGGAVTGPGIGSEQGGAVCWWAEGRYD